jgi:hypothetical protein
MNTPALPRDAKTWKLAAVVAMGLFVIFSLIVLMERWLHPERAPRERNNESREPMRRSLMPPDMNRQLQEILKEK